MTSPLSPQQRYPELLAAVQMARLFDDGKVFVDAVPRNPDAAALRADYLAAASAPHFDLAAFVQSHFELPDPSSTPLGAPAPTAAQHIRALWPQLVRHAVAPRPGDSLLPLPHPFVVPGGRFRELYYWDSYFSMLGLLLDGQHALARQMLANFERLVATCGYVPNSNRSYMLGRSQPPFLWLMVQALADPQGVADAYAAHLDTLRAEHAWWMRGSETLAPGQAALSVVRMPDSSLLNRYWDHHDTPRDESYREDVLTAQAAQAAQSGAPHRSTAQVCRDLRAAAASGWDFSSRWLADGATLHSIQTTRIVPVDLNALLWGLEQAIASGSSMVGHDALSAQFAERAASRAQALQRWCWRARSGPAHGGHFVDVHWADGTQQPALTAAAVVPLFVGLADAEQAADTAAAITNQGLLARNGLLTSRVRSGQQWDAPNGWAPLQWMAVQGLDSYGHRALARTIAQRWTDMVERVYRSTGRLLEKYDVEHDRPGGGGEYPTQDGFGWTNGTHRALQAWLAATVE